VINSNEGSDETGAGKSYSRIPDDVFAEIEKTRKTFRILIIAHLIALPAGLAAILILYGSPFSTFSLLDAPRPPSNPLTLPYVIPILVVLGWLGIAIRRWVALSKLSKAYRNLRVTEDPPG
jgi:hypothetical protein